MKKIIIAFAIAVALLMTFFAGYWYRNGSSGGKDAARGRKILYYVDPMNPGNRYDKPGIAPCGMQLEPVYADEGGAGAGVASSPPGSIRVSAEKQQLIGVRVEAVEKASSVQTLRLLGRVAADETRIYRINAFVDGWIRKVFPVSTGSQVKANEPLAFFYAPELLTAQSTYIYTMGSQERTPVTKTGAPPQSGPIKVNVQQYHDNLRNLGMSEAQIEELGRTRKVTQDIVISSPAQGVVISRNVSLGQRFEKGTELFRIADLRRVWILLDTYENEARYFRPGQAVQVSYQGKTFPARVSNVLSQFDASSRTLKVRLEADNPGFVLRPDMFVEVNFPVRMPSGITVPVDAVLDSGVKKTVFVERAPGIFEPRKVEVGRYADDRVEIVRGLMPGERIVVSGNFLIDSESRMRVSAPAMSGVAATDPVCGMAVDQGRARSSGLTSEQRGTTHYFCSSECKKQFDKEPRRATGVTPGGKPGHEMPESGGHHHD